MTEIDSCAWSALKQQKSKYSRNNSKSYISIYIAGHFNLIE